MKRKEIIKIFLAFMLVTSLVVGCSSSTNSNTSSAKPTEQIGAKELKIGSVLATSGASASLGQPVYDGVVYAVKKLNDAGGVTINGEKYTVKLIQYDDKGTADSTISAVQRLIENDKVAAIIGPITSTSALATMEVTEKAKIPMITPTAASPAVTQKGYKYIFRSIITGAEQVEAVTEYATKQMNLKTGAILARNDDWGRSSVDEFKKRLAAKGGQVVATEFFEATDKDFSSQLAKIKAANPDFVYVVSLTEDGAPIVKQYREMGIKAQLFSGEAANAAMAKLVGKDIVGVMTYFGYGPSSPETQAFEADFQKVMNKKSDPYNYNGADTLNLLVKAFEKAGTISDSEKLRTALLQTNYKGLKATYKFNDNGQANHTVWITKVVDDTAKREFLWHN